MLCLFLGAQLYYVGLKIGQDLSVRVRCIPSGLVWSAHIEGSLAVLVAKEFITCAKVAYVRSGDTI